MNNIVRIGSDEAIGETRASLHDDLLNRLRDFVVEGHLAPGARIPERDLCARFAISRTPLREALKVLAAEGLIELLPNRGARVRQFSEADIRNLFEVIAGLDYTAGRLAVTRISDDGIAEIERLHLDMYTSYMRHELSDYFRFNQLIHQAIIDATANPVLAANYASANAIVRRLRYSANLLHRDRLSDAMREHEGMIDALRRRDGEQLGQRMFAHMQAKCEAVCEYMRTQPAETAQQNALEAYRT